MVEVDCTFGAFLERNNQFKYIYLKFSKCDGFGFWTGTKFLIDGWIITVRQYSAETQNKRFLSIIMTVIGQNGEDFVM
jgi:hypothetical protein